MMTNRAPRKALFSGSKYDDNSDFLERQPLKVETQNSLVDENNAQINDIYNKASALKDIGVDIHSEIETHNQIIRGMNDSMSNTVSGLSGAINNVKHMFDTGGTSSMCLVIIIVILTFVAGWKLLF